MLLGFYGLERSLTDERKIRKIFISAAAGSVKCTSSSLISVILQIQIRQLLFPVRFIARVLVAHVDSIPGVVYNAVLLVYDPAIPPLPPDNNW